MIDPEIEEDSALRWLFFFGEKYGDDDAVENGEGEERSAVDLMLKMLCFEYSHAFCAHRSSGHEMNP